MSDQGDSPGDADDADPTESRGSFRDALRGLRRAASEVADAGSEEARKLAEAARPEIERRAKQAQAAVEAARPHVEQKAREAAGYVRDHQDEIVRASKRGAEVAASGAARAVTPGPLRPAIDAMERELRGEPDAESTDDTTGAGGAIAEDSAAPGEDQPSDGDNDTPPSSEAPRAYRPQHQASSR